MFARKKVSPDSPSDSSHSPLRGSAHKPSRVSATASSRKSSRTSATASSRKPSRTSATTSSRKPSRVATADASHSSPSPSEFGTSDASASAATTATTEAVKRRKLFRTTSFRISLVSAVLLLLFLLVFAMWNRTVQMNQAEEETLEKAQLLAREMNASWQFIEINQDTIDTDADGSYNFKGVYCAIAGKSIAALFSVNTDYVIRYVNSTPRHSNSALDEYETEAFAAFEEGATSYYGMATFNDEPYYRFVTPLYITEACLDCHGEPAGEIDVTGYAKEGHKIGDVAGAISIALPMSDYLDSINENIVNQVVLTFLMVLVIFFLLYVVVAFTIMRPVVQLEKTASDIESGNLDVSTASIRATGELRDLALRFETMAHRLKDSRDNLENQVAVRTEALTTANDLLRVQQDELENMNELLRQESQYKSDFLSMISHELKTPLTSIIAFTDLWKDTLDDTKSEESEAITQIEDNSQQLLFMVNNILEVARQDAGKEELSLEELDIVDVFGTIERNAQTLTQKRDQTLKVSISRDVPIIMGDWAKLRRISENLLSNAIKFTRKGGNVSFDVDYNKDTDSLILVVKDNGIGIQENELPHIFEKFVQVDGSANRRYNGSGLGLTVVKNAVDAYGGSISVESVYHEGSTFTVVLPAYTEKLNEDAKANETVEENEETKEDPK